MTRQSAGEPAPGAPEAALGSRGRLTRRSDLGRSTPERPEQDRYATLGDLLHVEPGGDASPAILTLRPDGSIETVTRAGLARRVHAAAGRLLQAGLRRGEQLLLTGPNSAEWIIACFGTIAAGGLPVPADAQLRGPEYARIARHCGARRAFAGAHQERELRAAAPEVAVTLLDTLRETQGAPEASGPPELPGLLPRLDAADSAALFYTSGTTGVPKAVPLSHANLLANVSALVAARITRPGDRLLLPLPLHHVYPFTCGLLGSLATGVPLVLPAAVSGPELVAAIRGAGATVLLGVPRLYTALLTGIEARVAARRVARRVFGPAVAVSGWLTRHTGWRAGTLLFRRLRQELGPSLRLLVSGGARLDPGTAARLEALGWEVLSGYGLTETAPILTFNVPGHVRHDTVGRPLPGVEIRIEPAANARGGEGEILARGPNVFAGYLANPEATQAAFTRDGWLRTGDVGYIDADGYLHVVGRLKEIIVLADGKNIVPEDLEPAYAASPLIREIALLEDDGRLVALIVPDEEAIRQRGAARLAGLLRDEIERLSLALPAYQRITDFRLTYEPLPRTPMGKLQRFRLQEIWRSGRAAAPQADAGTLADADRALLEAPLGRRVWSWLAERFPGKPLALDASPQLDLGIDSLEWVALTLEVRERFGVLLGQEAAARVLTVRDLVQAIAEAPRAQDAPAAGPAGAAKGPGRGVRPLGFVLYALDRLLMRLAFRLRVEGAHHLPDAEPLLLAPNHASYLDPLALAAALPWRLLPRMRWAGGAQYMFRSAPWRLLSRVTGVFPVDPDREPAAAVEAARALLGAGAVLAWFPEGRRSLDGQIGPFLPGIGIVLRDSGVRVLPVRIVGSFRALPWQRRWPRLVPITVIFGRPLDAAELEALGEGRNAAERIASGLRRAVVGLAGTS